MQRIAEAMSPAARIGDRLADIERLEKGQLLAMLFDERDPFEHDLLALAGAICDHTPFSKAARAAFTARSTSSLSHSATLVSTLPSIGEMQSKVLPDAAAVNLPSMKA